MEMKFLAHITDIDGERKEQGLKEHLLNTAEYAKERLQGSNFSNCGYLAGLLHDMGKYKLEYNIYLEKSYLGEKVQKGSVNHTFAGVKYLLERYHNEKNDHFDKLTSEILAYAIGSHHGEFDIINIDGENGFEYRLNKDKEEINYSESINNYFFNFITEENIDYYFLKAKEEIKLLLDNIKKNSDCAKTVMWFIFGMVARMILSAVIYSDRLDTAEFMSGKNANKIETSKKLWEAQLEFLDHKIKEFSSETSINKVRKYFSDKCKEFAKNENGIYKITIPTGAGKTLCMLRYSLAHAKEYNKKRIIFIIPLLSVLDQNSKVIREYIKNKDIVNEFHSNVVNFEERKEELNKFELLSESWDVPIMISTLVQLLNMLFKDKTSSINRMSSLCDSIIVIDEIQSLPKNMVYLFNSAINFLVNYCNATVVLSSATQPSFNKVKYPMKFSPNTDIVPFDLDVFSVFKRTEVVDKTTPYGMSIEELADFSLEIIEKSSSLLVICNTKSSALNLYNQIKLMINLNEYKIFHLSTSMCMKHRMDVLEEINRLLKTEKVLCVSTQLVEAGVDFSFESVIRVMAGIDNITQAAGRCNRNNDFDKVCNAYVVNLKNNDENLKMLKEIKISQDCTLKLLNDFKNQSFKYDNDLLSNKSIDTYYDIFFRNPEIENKFNYPIKFYDKTNNNLFEMLSHNETLTKRAEKKNDYVLVQSFKTANSLFEVFDENTTDVIVPYNKEAEEIIADLCSEKAKFNYVFMKEKIKKAKQYIIQIYEYQKKELEGMLFSDEGNHFIALNEQNYSKETGLEIIKSIF